MQAPQVTDIGDYVLEASTLSTGQGDRIEIRFIKFAQEFNTVPQVGVALNQIDA